ncbi:MAG: tRNA (N6-threonylcarbamoyladenosine(37)-N6)-methyltransferase TrmO [Desulfomonilaceae bacterium]
MTYQPIGVIHSPFTDPKDMPIQPLGARGVKGTVELGAQFEAGLKDLEGFSHIILLYHFHLSKGYSLHVVPFLDDVERGVFATRAPRRPNPVGLSIVRLLAVSGCHLSIEDVDIVDGTPLIDIKPFVPYFDHRDNASCGWLITRLGEVHTRRADDRFSSDE